jgi:hypothetical protein
MKGKCGSTPEACADRKNGPAAALKKPVEGTRKGFFGHFDHGFG